MTRRFPGKPRHQGGAAMMFRLAHPALLALLMIVLAWLAWRLTRKPVGITHSMTGVLAELSGGSHDWLDIFP